MIVVHARVRNDLRFQRFRKIDFISQHFSTACVELGIQDREEKGKVASQGQGLQEGIRRLLVSHRIARWKSVHSQAHLGKDGSAVGHLNQRYCFWLLDTRTLWVGKKIDDAAPDILARLSKQEAAKAQRFFFIKDAKLSVASSLLKRLFASKLLGIAWSKAEFARAVNETHGKPCIVFQSNAHSLTTGSPNSSTIASHTRADEFNDFNITHQAGLVALAGFRAVGRPSVTSVGVDIVCVNERNNHDDVKTVRDFVRWVDMYAEVFSQEDVQAMKAPAFAKQENTTNVNVGSLDEQEIQILMRRFYAFWALKEAYVKMEGEALLADWLQHVEFRCVKVPAPTQKLDSRDIRDQKQWGETISGIEAWFYGKKRNDVEIFLQAFEQDYMIATAFVTAVTSEPELGKSSIPAPEYRALDLHKDILPFAD